MIPALIFSKDRPMQLDLLLTSIERFAPFLWPTVLVKAQGADAMKGYWAILQNEHPTGVRWENQNPAPARFADSVRRFVRQNSHVAFFVDDDVFYRDAGMPMAFPWSWRGFEYDYPFSLDGCVYESETILPLLDFPFTNPTQLEAGVDAQRDRLPFTELFHGPGCLVEIPHNRVSVSSGMPHMGGDPEELTRRYLDGERIDLYALDFTEVQSNHEHIPYIFRHVDAGREASAAR